MMEQSQFNEIKQQLWDYYRKVNEYSMSLAEEIIFVNLLTGAHTTELFIPSGLRDELNFTEDEIRLWQKYEERFSEF
jgi:hypothetical protein